MKNLQVHGDCNNTSEEYETQYFCFGRNVLKNSLSSLVESKLQSQVDSAKKYFTSSLDLNEDMKSKVIDKCSNLIKLVLMGSQSSLETIYGDLDKYFSIPDNVLLPQDEIFKEHVDENEIERLKEEVEKWKASILALDAPQVILEKELSKTAVIKKHIVVKEQQLLNAINGLKSIILTEDIDTEVCY